MIRSYYYTPDDGLVYAEGIKDFRCLSERRDSVLWVDLSSPTDEESYILTSDFKFHPLAIEDVLSEMSHPKVDDYDNYLFTIVQVLGPPVQETEIEAKGIGLFLTPNAVVTVHFHDVQSLDSVQLRLQRDSRLISRGADFLFHTMLDHIVDTYFSAQNTMEKEVDLVEAQVFEDPDEVILKKMFRIRRDLAIIRRVVVPQSEIVSQFTREKFDVITPKAAIYFSDINDHLHVMISTADNQRDAINSAMDLYFSMVSTKTNDVIKFLTILSALFLPATFIVGYYGMNFETIPEFSWRLGFPFAVFLIVGVISGLLLFFRRKKWI
ncbi:MAG: magnesium/cobalt transporter CorA [Candidatus Zixiibacteriota bacterium]